MTEHEDRLRAALNRAADATHAVAPSADRLLRLHRRHVHRRNALLGASLATLGAGGWAVSTVAGAPGAGNDSIGVPTATGSTRPAAPASAPNAACAAGGSAGDNAAPGAVGASPSPSPDGSSRTQVKAVASSQTQAKAAASAVESAMQRPSADSRRGRAALQRITLPDPAPGFPVRRGEDTVMSSFGPGRFAWARTFLLAVKPGTTTTPASGVVDTIPNGQEATVIIACHGAFPTTADAIRAQHLNTVVASTTARGHTATVVRTDVHQIGVLLTVDGWDIGAYGDSSVVPNDPVTPAQLVALVDALANLDG